METVLEVLVVLPAAVMVVVGVLRGVVETPLEWRAAEEWRAIPVRQRPVLVHDSAKEKLLRSPGLKPVRAAEARLRLVYNGG